MLKEAERYTRERLTQDWQAECKRWEDRALRAEAELAAIKAQVGKWPVTVKVLVRVVRAGGEDMSRTCYRDGGCGPYEMRSCNECPASKPEYAASKPATLAEASERANAALMKFLAEAGKQLVGTAESINTALRKARESAEKAGVSLEDYRRDAMHMVNAERDRQESMWGEQNHTMDKWLTILGEEYGEVCQAIGETVLPNRSKPEMGGYDNIMRELTHLAAVSVAMMECMVRNRAEWGM